LADVEINISKKPSIENESNYVKMRNIASIMIYNYS